MRENKNKKEIKTKEQTTPEYYLRWAVEKCSKKGKVCLPCDKVLEIAARLEENKKTIMELQAEQAVLKSMMRCPRGDNSIG